RATPPGKCHSCNIRETPEWRRGPDGARTLCNACGLHYAKLVRKRDKAAAEGNGSNMHIDMEMLRASTRAAETEKTRGSGSGNSSGSGNGASVASGAGTEMEKMGVHTGSFQIMNVAMGPDSNTPMQTPTPSQSQTQTQGQGPAQPSQSQSSPPHHPQGYQPDIPPPQQHPHPHQSFMRTSHSVSNGASPP
ncbi:hypothetical protein J3A83DRAFT_4107962, partial [Scleroderma citrinum]